jgi:hypothetical protein
MNKLLSICLMLSLLGQCTLSLWIVANYSLQKERITQLYCVNKSKPQLNCCGKCYLNKQLKKSTNSNPEKSQQKQIQLDQHTFILPIQYGIAYVTPTMLNELNPTLQHMFDCKTATDILHPPLVDC